MCSRLGRSITCLFVVLAFAASGSAQQATGEVHGRVVDQQSGALPGVTITITNLDTGNFREVISGADGTWLAPALPPGKYQIAAQIEDFKKSVRQGMTLAVGNQLAIDIQLELGGIEETITVSSDAPLIDVTSKEIGGNITTKELADIPTISRNFTYFAGLLPGVGGPAPPPTLGPAPPPP